MRLLYLEKGGFLKLGTDFETWVGSVLNIEKSNLRVFNGEIAKKGVRAGYAVIDYIYKGSILEIKLSGGAIKEQQAKQLALHAEKEGMGLTYIFMNAPTADELKDLNKWVQEVTPGLNVNVNYLFP